MLGETGEWVNTGYKVIRHLKGLLSLNLLESRVVNLGNT